MPSNDDDGIGLMMSTSTKSPVFFLSHGAPTFAIEPGALGSTLQILGEQLSNLRAVLVLSPHWQTKNLAIMSTILPKTMHDFGGFPSKLYDLQYQAKGQPDIAKEAAILLATAGWTTQFDDHRGFDHGAWVPLMHLLPKAHIPVFQVSMPFDLNTQQAFKLGQTLEPLRHHGVLIVASGNMTHNLGELRSPDSLPVDYAQEFASWVKTKLISNAINSLMLYRTEAPYAERAHPTEEHFLPLLFALGTLGTRDAVQFIAGGTTYGVLSMDSYAWGMPNHGTVRSLV